MKINKTLRCERTRDSAQGLFVRPPKMSFLKNLTSTNQWNFIKNMPYSYTIHFYFYNAIKKLIFLTIYIDIL